jgi:hypothetical protein
MPDRRSGPNTHAGGCLWTKCDNSEDGCGLRPSGAQFRGFTFFPQPNKGFWKMADVTYRDEIVVYRVIATDAIQARRFFSDLKERLKKDLEQHETPIVEREIETL